MRLEQLVNAAHIEKLLGKLSSLYNAAKQQHVAIRFMTLHGKPSYRSSPASKVLDQSYLRERHKYAYTISKVRPEQHLLSYACNDGPPLNPCDQNEELDQFTPAMSVIEDCASAPAME